MVAEEFNLRKKTIKTDLFALSTVSLVSRPKLVSRGAVWKLKMHFRLPNPKIVMRLDAHHFDQISRI